MKCVVVQAAGQWHRPPVFEQLKMQHEFLFQNTLQAEKWILEARKLRISGDSRQSTDADQQLHQTQHLYDTIFFCCDSVKIIVIAHFPLRILTVPTPTSLTDAYHLFLPCLPTIPSA